MLRVFFLSVGLILLTVPSTAQTCTVTHDVDGNDAFELADPEYLLNYLFAGGAKPVCPGQTDANGDGTTNIADAVVMFDDYACESATVGDVNGSGALAMADVDYLLEYLFLGGPAPVPCLDVADVNGDGSVSLADATALSSSLPCPPALTGDANGDESLDIADMLLVAQSFTGGPGPVPCALAGDLNGDGSFDIADLIAYAGLF